MCDFVLMNEFIKCGNRWFSTHTHTHTHTHTINPVKKINELIKKATAVGCGYFLYNNKEKK